MIRVCSGWHPAGRALYGDRFLTTFDRRWAREVDLQVYTEEPEKMARNACRDLWSIPGAREFYMRHKNDDKARGLVPQPCWKPTEVAKGYSFRTDAFKFFKQILIPGKAASDMADGDILIWLDGDVETVRSIPDRFIPALMDGVDVCYLGRQPQHSEIGFWAVRINEKTRHFLALMAEIYLTGCVFELPEWHSAYVWDRAREKCNLIERNLCKPGARGHVFEKSPLAPYLVHRKGARKGIAR